MDHSTNFFYVCLVRYSTLEFTLESKATYDNLCDTNGVQIKSYHVDNGRFIDLAFKTAVSEVNQRISFFE